jgi:molecular chaperone DnaK (HSP70)
MSKNITEVIGFDLGHGETALARLYLADLDKKSEPELIEILGRKNQITAIGYHPKKGILIGESALIVSGVEEFYITFKRKPSGDPAYQRIMHDYIKTIYNNQREQGRINENESFFIVGCPSAWTQDPTIVTAYEKLFLDAGIQQVKVVAESRAAYIHAVEKGILKMAESKGSVVVIDLGSSTTDITLINQSSSSIPIDVGRELGAAAIDKAIFQWAMQNNPDQAEFGKIFKDYPHFQNRCELNCREVKEAYFSAPENYKEPGEYASRAVNIQGRYFTTEIDGTVMNEILNTPFVELEGEFKTWPVAFENELVKLRQELELRQQLDISKVFSPGVILLTGGPLGSS